MTEPNEGRMRAGDDDRDRVVEQLRTHHEAGRLDAEEFTQRMESALLARYLDELPPLLTDLPRIGPAPDERSGPNNARTRWAGGRARGGFVPHLLPAFAIVFALAVAGSIVLIASGRFPFPLIWVGLGFLWLFKWRSWQRRNWAAQAGSVRPREIARARSAPAFAAALIPVWREFQRRESIWDSCG